MKLKGKYRIREFSEDEFFVELDKQNPDHPYNIEVLGEDFGGDIYTPEMKRFHAELMVDAGNTHIDCNMKPSEMLKMLRLLAEGWNNFLGQTNIGSSFYSAKEITFMNEVGIIVNKVNQSK